MRDLAGGDASGPGRWTTAQQALLLSKHGADLDAFVAGGGHDALASVSVESAISQ